MKVLRTNGGFHSKQKLWNFIKNKLLKFFNSTKIGYAFAGLNLNIFLKKAPEKCTFHG